MNKRDDDQAANPGPNLWLIYGLMALGLLIAIGIALMVVFPFYQHRH